MRKFKVVKPYYFLAVGTILRRNTSGNYFVSMKDEAWEEARIHGQTPTLEGGLVENDTEHFQEVTGEGEEAYKDFIKDYLALCDRYGMYLAPSHDGRVSHHDTMLVAPLDGEAEMFIWRTRPAPDLGGGAAGSPEESAGAGGRQ